MNGQDARTAATSSDSMIDAYRREIATQTELVDALRAERARRERVIRRYQRRARAAVRVLQKHGLGQEYLDAYEKLGGEDG